MDPDASSDLNDHERPLGHLGDPEPGPPPSADTLTDIVTRYRQRRTRALGGALVVALLAGPAVGFAVGRSGHRASGQTVATAGGGGASIPRQDTANGMSMSSGGTVWSSSGSVFGGPAPTRLFLRDAADGVRVRVYLEDFRGEAGSGVPAECFPKQFLDAEVSDAIMAGNAQAALFAGTPAPDPVTVIGAQSLGELEGSPVTVVTLRTAANVARVRATFIGGVIDEMTPVDGWAVLGGHRPAGTPAVPGGTLTALDAAGKALATVDLASAAQPTMPIPAACRNPGLPPGVPSDGPPPPVSAPPVTVAPAVAPTTTPLPTTSSTPTTRP